MIITSVLFNFLSSYSYVSAVFLLMFASGLLLKIVRD